jgi:uncharacterized membrane protein YbhN (UPF0104 family)
VDERVRRGLVIARWLATPILVAGVLWFVDVRAVAARLAHLEGRFVAMFLHLSAPLYLLYAWRWRFTAARLGAPLPFRRAYLEYYVSTLLNQVLPVGIAGDVVRAARHKRAFGAWGPPARAVILERFSGFVGLALFVLASAATWIARGERAFVGVFAGALVLVLPIAILASKRRAAWLEDARAALVARGALGFQLGVSLASVALLLVMFACAGRAAGVDLDAASVVQVVPLVLAATTIPWAFAGWGAREASTATLFGLMGKGAADGVTVSVTFGVLSLAAAAPGVIVLCLPRGKEP